MAGSQDAWRINGEDRSKHDAQFYQLKPVNGFVTGTQARDFFVQSGLPTPILGQIWTLADMNGDGKMDKKEFSIAMHLIKKKLQGYELPKVLPASLKADPTPVIGSFAQPGMGTSMNIGFPMGGMPASMGAGMGMQMQPMIQPQASLGTATMTTGSLSMGPRMANGAAGNMPHPPGSLGTMPLTGGVPITGVPGSSAPPSGGSIWAMPHNSKLKHTQVFNANDRNKRGYLLGVEARALLMQSGLPQNVLAQIWTLSDIDRDGKLTCDEFCIAMHLSELARMGHTLPPTLPPELLPSKARSGSLTSPPTANLQGTPKKDAFGDLLGSSGIPQPGSAVPAAPQTAEEQAAFDEQVTFEDRRKENFDKGQAELERRRAILREQQKKEENERLEKERQEAEKRERQRQEAESKRQAELQRQLERQREKEREIEEQRRKMMEQREAARRELERQRQMEWEKQRKEQLMAERQRELEQLSMTKSRMANLKNELESLDAKKAELSLKVTQVQKGVTDFTTSIDAMRVSRDRTLADIDLFERQSMELNKKLSTLGGEKERLNIQVQTAQSTPLSDLHRTVSHSIETKKASIQQLKKQVEQLESDTEARLGEIDCNNAELKNMKDQLAKLERDLPQLQKQQDDKIALQKKAALEMQQKQRLEKEKQEKMKQELQQQQKKAPSLPASTASSNSDPSWFDFNSSEAVSSVASAGSAVSWDTAFSGTTGSASQSTSAAWGVNGTKGGTKSKMKYRALYDFAATRDDELTLIAGTEVWVLADVTPVPGMEDWYKGENEGKIGWFPKAYVEALEEPSTDLFGSAFEPVVSTSAQKTESSKTDIFNSDFSQSSAISNTPTTSSSDPTSTSHIPPEGLLAKATYPWKARQDTDLTFDKDDVILVKEKQDMKWFGELNGKSGWFPKAYVKLIGVASKAEAPVDKAPPSQLNTDMKADTSSVSPAPPDGQGEYYIAMYTYQSDEPSDLNFSEGEMILVTAASGDWWTGTLVEQGKTGIFPATYVKKLEIQPEPEPKNQMLKKPEIARVIAPYVATGTGQLSLETGNLINVRQKSPRGWWEGELQVRGQKKKIGWFPANYVKLLGGSSARSTPEPTAAAQLTVTGAPGSRSATPQSTASQDGVTAINNPETVVALYPYAAQNEDELTFQKDSVITVLSRDNPDWWSGQLDGQTGVFPSNYVTPNPQSMSWMNDTQGTLSKAERKRQQAIQELINTEETYNSDMQIALEVFKQPLINNSVLPKDQVNQIFVNWEELIVCNKKFLQALRVRKKMCGKNGIIVSIGDILCESLPHMNPYMRFCSCQLSAAATLQRVSENIPAFQEFHKATMRDSRVKGVHLSGYLLKPMQRITRYPLLIEKILGSTPDDHADRGNLEEALNLAQELCSQANQCVKEKQNSDSLEWIQANVHCDGLAENIVFNSLTNCLGPRRLLFHGILYKAKSNKELVGFLFNDFLMLAHTSRQLGPTFSTVHLFDTSTQFKMYRMPIFLNEVSVKKPTEEADPTLFHITSDRIINLKAISAIERDTWVREIEAASKQYKDKAKRKLERAHSVKRPNVGRILVVIQEACHLKASDANGKSDPYCEVSMGSQEHRTKVISSTLNPRWNASMQFMIRDVDRDTLCFTIYDRDLYSPNDFLGRTEVRIRDVLDESGERRGPITRRLILHEVETGEVVVKLDLQLFESS